MVGEVQGAGWCWRVGGRLGWAAVVTSVIEPDVSEKFGDDGEVGP